MSDFQEMIAMAKVVAHDQLIPDHFRGAWKGKVFTEYDEQTKIANAFSVINKAALWGMNALLLAEHSYVVHGKLDYSGVLYAALANSRGGLAENLNGKIEGSGDDLKITIFGTFAKTGETRTVEVRYSQARTYDRDGNVSQQWKEDPERQLHYAGYRKWVKLHCPEVLCGLVPVEAESAIEEAMPSPAATLAAIEHKPQPVDYGREIAGAQSRQLLRQIAKSIDSDSSLSSDEKQLYRAQGKQRWVELGNSAAEDAEPTSGPSEAFQRWERTIKTEPNQEQRLRHCDAIEADAALSIEEAQSLMAMIDGMSPQAK